MAKKKARPAFKLPSTEPAAGPPASAEWVYRSDAAPAAVVAVAVDDPVAEPVTRLARARRVVTSYSRYAAAAGLIPIPAVDLVAVGSLQLKMVAALAEVYEVPFNNDFGKSVIAAVIGSVGSTNLAWRCGRSMLKTIPVIGPFAGSIAMSTSAFALTWAIGRVFVRHFDAGGTLADADTPKMNAQFESEFAAAG